MLPRRRPARPLPLPRGMAVAPPLLLLGRAYCLGHAAVAAADVLPRWPSSAIARAAMALATGEAGGRSLGAGQAQARWEPGPYAERPEKEVSWRRNVDHAKDVVAAGVREILRLVNPKPVADVMAPTTPWWLRPPAWATDGFLFAVPKKKRSRRRCRIRRATQKVKLPRTIYRDPVSGTVYEPGTVGDIRKQLKLRERDGVVGPIDYGLDKWRPAMRRPGRKPDRWGKSWWRHPEYDPQKGRHGRAPLA